jgi:hypothetical protein
MASGLGHTNFGRGRKLCIRRRLHWPLVAARAHGTGSMSHALFSNSALADISNQAARVEITFCRGAGIKSRAVPFYFCTGGKLVYCSALNFEMQRLTIACVLEAVSVTVDLRTRPL